MTCGRGVDRLNTPLVGRQEAPNLASELLAITSWRKVITDWPVPVFESSITMRAPCWTASEARGLGKVAAWICPWPASPRGPVSGHFGLRYLSRRHADGTRERSVAYSMTLLVEIPTGTPFQVLRGLDPGAGRRQHHHHRHLDFVPLNARRTIRALLPSLFRRQWISDRSLSVDLPATKAESLSRALGK